MPKEYTTYFLGAGASANALPTLAQMPARMASFAHWLTFQDRELFSESELKELVSYISNCISYGTPDTYAKLLYFSKSNDLERFKRFITLFFLFEQSTISKNRATSTSFVSPFSGFLFNEEFADSSNEILDYRYPHLFASVFNQIDMTELQEKKMRFITWNYDIQIAILITQILKCSLNEALNFLDENPKDRGVNSDYRMLYAINGTAIFTRDSRFRQADFDLSTIESTRKLARKIFNHENGGYHDLRYSWDINEQKRYFQPYFSEIASLLAETRELIVVGYSFPTYNRLVDKELLSGFKGNIVIQSKEAHLIKDRILTILPPDHIGLRKQDLIVTKSDVATFHIPDSLLV